MRGWMFGVAVVLASGAAWGQDEASYDVVVEPGQMVAVKLDAATGTFEPEILFGPALTGTAREAVQAAPSWLRPLLTWRLSGFEPMVQETLGGAILAVEDPRLVDEVAFGAASLWSCDVREIGFVPGILEENARVIYEMDDVLDYVELVDVGDPETDDDFHTTVRFTMPDGEVVELDQEVYYWYVVHPRFSNEIFGYIDPSSGRGARVGDGGVLWRSYYAYQHEDPAQCAWLHFIMEHPNMITAGVLDGLSYPAQGYLEDFELDPLVLVSETGTGRPVLVQHSWPGGYYDGTVIATTIPLEREHEDGNTELLENLVRAGAASAMLRPGEGHRTALIKDRDPWGVATVEAALAAAGLAYDVYGSDGIGTITLDDYHKVIVPSAQPRVLHERLAAADAALRAWLRPEAGADDIGHERVLEIHGAIDLAHPEDDWCGIALPGGLTCAHQTDVTIDSLSLGGYPKLLDALEGTTILWDRVGQGFSGNLPLEPDAHALRAIGFFGTQNMVDRCAEIPSYYGGPDAECTTCNGRTLSQTLRSRYPQRTLYLHFGNCGEMQQVLGAAGRASLVPVAHVDSYAQDHVWDEFFLDERWYHYEIGRSDGGTSIDTRHDQAWGSVARWRGDGWVENATELYSAETFTVEFTVTDSEGRPVDGAAVVLASDYNKVVGGTVPIVRTNLVWTDRQGKASIVLGTGYNVYYRVESSVGVFPSEDSVEKAACVDGYDPRGRPCPEDSSVDGAVYSFDVTLPGSLGRPEVSVSSAEGDRLLGLDVVVGPDVLFGTNPMTGETFYKTHGQGVLDVHVVDQANLDLARAGSAFEALGSWSDVTEVMEDLPIDLDTDLYVVLSSAGTAHTGAEAEVTLIHDLPTGDDAPDDPTDADTEDAQDETTLPDFTARGGSCGCTLVH